MMDLIPCPFCGGEAFGHTSEANAIFKEFVCCDTCNACTDVFANKEDAVKAWNRRHHRECIYTEINGLYLCSICGIENDYVDEYCPSCGSKVTNVLHAIVPMKVVEE